MTNIDDDFSTNTIANYTVTGSGAVAISSGVLAISGTTTGDRNVMHNSAPATDDVEIAYTFGAAPTTTFSSVLGRVDSAVGEFIAMHMRSSTPRIFVQRISTSHGVGDLIGGVSPTLASGDRITCEARGAFYVLRKNGLQFASRWDWDNSVEIDSSHRRAGPRLARVSTTNCASCTRYTHTELTATSSLDPFWVGEGFSTTVISMPSNTADGDLMIACAAKTTESAVSWPAGWTELRDVSNTATGATLQFTVGYRFKQSGDPSTWTMPTSCTASASISVRNVDPTTPFAVEDILQSSTSATPSSPTVTNSDARGFMVGMSANEASAARTHSTTTVSTTLSGAQVFRGPSQVNGQIAVSAWHSGWVIPTGSMNYTYELSAAPDGSFAWIGILNPAPLDQDINDGDTATGTDAATGKLAGTQADTAAGSDAATGKLAGTQADAATGSETATANLAGTRTDTATGAEATAIVAQIPATDSATAAESVSIQIAGAVDSGSVAEAVTGIRLTGLTDTGTGTESGTGNLAGTQADTGTATETATGNLAGVRADTATATEAATGNLAGIQTDTATGTESQFVDQQGTFQVTETGTAAETASIRIDLTDTATASDTAYPSQQVDVVDAATGTEAFAVLHAQADASTATEQATGRLAGTQADTAAGTEAQSIRLISTDQATATDTASVRQGVTDTGTGTEQATTTIGASDAASATETAFITIVTTDGGVGADVASIALTSTDQGTGTDAVNVLQAIIVTDSGAATDAVTQLRVSVVDPATADENAYIEGILLSGTRVYHVVPEDRTMYVVLETRTFVAQADPRLNTVADEVMTVV